jgi:hypothetical protein
MTDPNEIDWRLQMRKLLEEFELVEISDIDPPYDAVWETSIGIERMTDFVNMGVWDD